MSPIVALDFALSNQIDQLTPTLFVLSCKNYSRFEGIVLNNEACTAYPSESEVLLSEGIGVYVLAVDVGVAIENSTGGAMATYNDCNITVIHLFTQI